MNNVKNVPLMNIYFVRNLQHSILTAITIAFHINSILSTIFLIFSDFSKRSYQNITNNFRFISIIIYYHLFPILSEIFVHYSFQIVENLFVLLMFHPMLILLVMITSQLKIVVQLNYQLFYLD